MESVKEHIIDLANKNGRLLSQHVADRFGVSRQYATRLIAELVEEKKLLKFGSRRDAFYVLPEYAKKHKELFPFVFRATFKNSRLEEHKVLDRIERAFPLLLRLPENVKSIFTYAFSEMFNNAIEHSTSKRIGVEISIEKGILLFIVKDSGVGVFKNVMQKRHLNTELEAIQDIMKGKTTTMPKSHSGEGIFFTSKAGDLFELDSFDYQLVVDNEIPDVFVHKTNKTKRGTQVTFKIKTNSKRHLADIFKEFTDVTGGDDLGFDKTKIQIKLYTMSGVHISRSQARRVLTGLEKFKHIIFDFDQVPVVGQAFADEVFRVFHHAHSKIVLEETNMNEGVKFMVDRAKSEAKKER